MTTPSQSQFVRQSFAAFTLLGLLAGAARAEGVTGVLGSVNTEAKKIVVMESGTDRKVELTVTDRTRYATGQGRPLKLADLKKGDGVGVTVEGSAALAVVVNQSALTGVVDEVEVEKGKFTVTQAGETREFTAEVTAKTPILSVEGKALGLKDVKTGDGVTVTFAGHDVLKVTVNPKPEEITGHVKSIAADMKSIVVTEVGTETDVKVVLTGRTTLVTNQSKTLELKDLKKGDGVGVAHHGSVASKIVVNPAPAR